MIFVGVMPRMQNAEGKIFTQQSIFCRYSAGQNVSVQTTRGKTQQHNFDDPLLCRHKNISAMYNTCEQSIITMEGKFINASQRKHDILQTFYEITAQNRKCCTEFKVSHEGDA